MKECCAKYLDEQFGGDADIVGEIYGEYVSAVREKIAEAAFSRLLARIADSSLQPCTIALPADLVVRASSSVHAAHRRR